MVPTLRFPEGPVTPHGAYHILHDRLPQFGLTSYDGGVYYGLNADRDSMPDIDVLGQSIVDSLGELLDSHRAKAR